MWCHWMMCRISRNYNMANIFRSLSRFITAHTGSCLVRLEREAGIWCSQCKHMALRDKL